MDGEPRSVHVDAGIGKLRERGATVIVGQCKRQTQVGGFSADRCDEIELPFDFVPHPFLRLALAHPIGQ